MMKINSLTKVIKRAYETLDERKWDKIYVALDLHDTVMEANYRDANCALMPICIDALVKLSQLPEISIILYSCCHPKDYDTYLKVFNEYCINIDFFNENPNVKNTVTGCFDKKFYYSILIDDKAGFDPAEWPDVVHDFFTFRQYSRRVEELEDKLWMGVNS